MANYEELVAFFIRWIVYTKLPDSTAKVTERVAVFLVGENAVKHACM